MNIEAVYQAHERIKSYLTPTPLHRSGLLHDKLNQNVWLKLESLNPTNSFKVRPAFNSIIADVENARKHGVIACSSGNFAQAVAYAAQKLGINALIVMRKGTSAYKVERTRSFGAEVVFSGDSHSERQELTSELQQKTGRVMLYPYNSELTIAGDATTGMEICADLGSILDQDAAILVPVSGGGLIAGIAYVIKHLHPSCKMIAIQPAVSSTVAKSLRAGKNVNVGTFSTLADALVASELGSLTYPVIKDLVDEAILIEENDILAAVQYMLEEHKLVVEPAAALPVAALLKNAISAKNIICIVSGGNIDLRHSVDHGAL